MARKLHKDFFMLIPSFGKLLGLPILGPGNGWVGMDTVRELTGALELRGNRLPRVSENDFSKRSVDSVVAAEVAYVARPQPGEPGL
jgi:hypothetical protein